MGGSGPEIAGLLREDVPGCAVVDGRGRGRALLDEGLALALDGGEDAVEGGLHADHLALHDLEKHAAGRMSSGTRRGGQRDVRDTGPRGGRDACVAGAGEMVDRT